MHEAISHNSELKRLRNEGYAVAVVEGYLVIHDIPYLDSSLKVRKGIMVSTLNISGNKVTYLRNNGLSHVMYFHGEQPYRANGEELLALKYQEYGSKLLAGIEVNRAFSNKPAGDYANYYEKVVNYANILAAEAQAVDPTVTPKTYRRVFASEYQVFQYEDTNSSRAAISDISDKFKGRNIAIIGLGGTGSYILDQVAKTPVESIHLFDDDVFCQHNAFRAPGAPDSSVFAMAPKKTDYFKALYGHMHKNIVSHPYRVDETTVDELTGIDFVFISIDSGPCKRIMVDKLFEQQIPFIDCGIDINQVGGLLTGTLRATSCLTDDKSIATDFISFEKADEGIYNSNIQTADLNCFCALMAVIEWKKACGFYKDISHHTQLTYSVSGGKLI